MAATPRAFFKRTGRTDSEVLLDWSGVPSKALEAIEPSAAGQPLADALLGAIDEAGPEVRDKAFAAIDQIEQLRDDLGFRALRSVALASSMSAAEFDAFQDVSAAAIHVLVRNQTDFDRAVASHYADRHRGGRSCSGFSVGQPSIADLKRDPAAREAFEAAAKGLFSSDPLNGRCLFDWFERRVRDPATGEEHGCTQATIYLEERPRAEPRISDAGGIVTETRRPVVEGAVVFDSGSGQIDVVAKGGKVLHQGVAKAFIETMVDNSDGAAPVEMRRLDLRSLTADRHFEIRAEDGVDAVTIERLTLLAPHDGMAVTLATRTTVIDDGGLHDMAMEAFGKRSPLVQAGWRVVAATLHVAFAPETSGGRSKRLTVELSLPNRTNLRDQTERHRLVAHKLLERWKLYALDDG